TRCHVAHGTELPIPNVRSWVANWGKADKICSSSKRKTDCELNAMSESIQNKCVNDSSDRNLSTILAGLVPAVYDVDARRNDAMCQGVPRGANRGCEQPQRA